MSEAQDEAACYLVLEDGTIFPGLAFGAPRQIEGEIGKPMPARGARSWAKQHVVRAPPRL